MTYSTYHPSSCFISDAAVFFGTVLGPIFAILLFNGVIFVVVIGVLIRHSQIKVGLLSLMPVTDTTAVSFVVQEAP